MKRDKHHARLAALLLGALLVLQAAQSRADEFLSTSGRIDLRGVWPIDSDSIPEGPSAEGRIKLDLNGEQLRFHSWLEGGWDGTVRKPVQDNSLFKNYDQVYQSNTPYLEFKELFLSIARGGLDLRAGIQRFSWGRLDEYPVNDLLNPWDYTRFLRKPLEDRKIGVPSLSAQYSSSDWSLEAVWVPVLVPYRLPMPYERWSGVPLSATFSIFPNVVITPQEPTMPDRDIRNGNVGLRLKRGGDIEWALNLYHGYDPRPIFRTTALTIIPIGTATFINPGYVPDFHRITTAGLDAAAVRGDLSLRAELAYTVNRPVNIRRELWGYQPDPTPGVNPLNPSIEQMHDALDYGIGADYRVFEDGLLTVQAQQTVLFGNVELLYERQVETLLWANLRAGFMNQKIETNINLAWNPEHGDRMTLVNGWYVFSDFWKAGLAYVALTGPGQSLFGRFSRNDQIEAEIRYSW
jgi:hypothetical protein